jgi:predicted dehydrogenase
MRGMSAVTRRGFLKGGMVALGAPCLVSPSVLGAERAAPSDRIAVGLIGMGKQCGWHLGTMLGRPDTQVLAVCDVELCKREAARKAANDRYAAEKAKGSYKGCDAYNDFRELVDRPDIDAVVIATPDHWHAIPVIRAAESGKDVYCEKPLSLTIGEARAMVNAIRRYGRVFQTGSQQRSGANFRIGCEMVRSGRIGKVHTVHVNVGGPSVPCDLPGQPVREGVDWDLWLGPAPWRPFHETICPPVSFGGWPQWRNYRDYSGGGMTDMGAHHFDIAQWGMGTELTGPVEIIPPDGKEHRWLTYKYANGITMHHGGGQNADVTFIGADGKIMVGRHPTRTEPPEILATPIGAHEVHLYSSNNHHGDWLDCIRTRQKPICDVEIGCRSVSICHLGNLAYVLKRPLKWDPAKEQFLGDDEANRWVDRPKREPWTL